MKLFDGWGWYGIWLVVVGFGGGMIVGGIYGMGGGVWGNGGRESFNGM